MYFVYSVMSLIVQKSVLFMKNAPKALSLEAPCSQRALGFWTVRLIKDSFNSPQVFLKICRFAMF